MAEHRRVEGSVGWRRRRATVSDTERSYEGTLAAVLIGVGEWRSLGRKPHMWWVPFCLWRAWQGRRVLFCLEHKTALKSMALQGAISGLSCDARAKFLQRKRGEAETPFPLWEALLVLGRKAYPQMGEMALDSLAAERLLALARVSGIVLPFSEGMGITSLKVAQEIQGHEARQH